jgi:hypothetical protein
MAIKTKKDVKRKKGTPSKKGKPSRTTTIRETSKLAGLNKRYFSKVKQEFHDIDYADELNQKEKEFLSSFMEENLGARFNHSGKKLNKSKSSKREIYNENNARQRDTYAVGRASGGMVDIDPEVAVSIWQERYVNHNFEDEMFKPKEEIGLMTRREYQRLVDSGADIPEDMVLFYTMYYDLEQS